MRVPGITVGTALFTAASLGTLASAILMVRSHVRSAFWANVILWLGMLMVAAGVCAISVLLPR